MFSQYKDPIMKIIHNHLPGCKIYLFGMKVKDENAEQELEIFIAIDAGMIGDPGIMGNIYSDIKKELISIDVDMVDINEVSLEMRDRIISKGVLLNK